MTQGFQLRRVLRGFQPVLCTASHLYLFRRGYLYRADHDLDNKVRLARIPADRPLLSWAPRIVERILRTAVQNAAQCDDDTLLLARRSRIWRVDLNSGAVVLDHIVPNGRSLLALNRITTADGTNWVVFGDYFNNPDRAEVRLWRRRCDPQAAWEIAATFPAGEINHVHAIQQLGDGKVYVLTGDFDQASGVWETDAEFTRLKPVMRGSQQFRACWWFERGQRVIYGTDSQFEPNKLLIFRPDSRTVKTIMELPGSCIYHGRTGTDLVFSTTVEPGASTASFVRDLLSRAVGPGITGDPTIFLYSGEVSEVLSVPKDAWPSRLGQFGTFMFPVGTAPSNRIYAYGVAVRKYDGDCLVFER